ncbi:MAG: hypothetical protein ABFR47_05750 [Verrucomicrobiota bacterium]
MARLGGRFFVCVLALVLVHEAAGRGLADLKKKSEKKAASEAEKKDEGSAQPRSDAATSSFGSGTYPSSSGGEGFLSSFWGWLIAAPFQYRHDDPAASMSPDEGGWAGGYQPGFPEHDVGQATVPYVRVDYNWQYIDSANDAQDGRIEVGYKAVALHARTTRYVDDSAGLDLDLNQYYAVLRYGGYRPDFLPGTFEFGVGFGVCQTIDDSENSSGALTIPIKYYPADWWGIEFRPAWYKGTYWGAEFTTGDYDLSASLGYRFMQLRGGYRWLWLQGAGHYLNGPYAGVSVSF